MASALPSSTSTARRSWPYSPRTSAELRQLDQEVQDPSELGRAEVVVADHRDGGQTGPADDGHALVAFRYGNVESTSIAAGRPDGVGPATTTRTLAYRPRTQSPQ